MRFSSSPRRPHGAALLSAMLTVTLVATFAAAALWQQWRSVEVEAAERARVQSVWILTGALDWARLILRADRITGEKADHLGEPWAVPLEESRLSSFLAADQNNSGGQTNEEAFDAFLSGRILDLQARLNLGNLVEGDKTSGPWYNAFAKLFQLLGLPEAELSVLAQNLRRAWAMPDTEAATAPIGPQRIAQLVQYGLSPATLAVLEPYVALLPVRPTKININTASAVVLAASEPLLSLSDAERLVSARTAKYFRSIAEPTLVLGAQTTLFAKDQLHDVESGYFEVRGRLRLESVVLEERSLVRRDGYGNGTVVRTLARERLSFDDRAGPDGGAAVSGSAAQTAAARP